MTPRLRLKDYLRLQIISKRGRSLGGENKHSGSLESPGEGVFETGKSLLAMRE
jgi:hypothetical protein